MLTVSSRFSLAEKADVNQIASRVYLLLGNYASASAFGATVSASGSDASGDYPAAGAIDGDRTEINVGPASGADNDVGLSSWRSAVAPSVTPQTLTINFNASRTINRIKLYHLASHGLSSYKLESSPDNITYTLIAKTTDQGGTITTTNQLDTIDFTNVTCQYIKLTIANTVVVADKANVVELECYRRYDVSDRVMSVQTVRSRDYKVLNPLASTFQILVDNRDKFFSPSHTPTTAEVASGFVNSELQPGTGIIVQYGFAYSGDTPEFVTTFNGNIDRFSVGSRDRVVTIEGRDTMKVLINQIVSSKLKTSLDIKFCMQYALNLANISNWEMSLDSTSLTLDYFFVNNQSIISVVRDLVVAAADATFYFDESGTAVFRSFVGATPESHTDSSEADFELGTVLTNVDTKSTPGSVIRKWYLIDDFADGEYFVNPNWTNRAPTQSATDSTEADFESGTVLTNIDTTSVPDRIGRKWFLVDDFADGEFATNPTWSVRSSPGGYSTVSTALHEKSTGSTPSNKNDITSPFTQTTGTWRFREKINQSGASGGEFPIFYFISNGWSTVSPIAGLEAFRNSYGVQLSTGLLFLIKTDGLGTRTPLGSGAVSNNDGAYHSVRITMDALGNIKAYFDEVLIVSVNDTSILGSVQVGFSVNNTTNPNDTCDFDDIYYSPAIDGTGAISTSQAVFESRVIDQSSVTSEGIFTATNSVPSGCTIAYFTATSADGISFDAYLAVTNGGQIQSTPRRYIKWKAVLTTPNDNGFNSVFTTPTISDVTITWSTVGWAIVSHQLKFAPLTSNARQGIDTFQDIAVGTWRTLLTMTVGSASGEIARLYFITTGYDIPTNTYLSGYYVEVNQAAGSLNLYKISSSGTRTLLATSATAITGAQHSLRVTRTAAGLMTVYWDEVSKCNATDTSFSAASVLAFEVDPNSDQNGSSQFDDVYFSNQVDGTGAITNTQAIFESQVVDMTSAVSLIGLFQATTDVPTGCAVAYYTATSADGVTFDSYVAAANGSAVASAVKRYIKWKAVLTCPIDTAGNNADLTTPSIFDVTLNWLVNAGSSKFPTTVSYTFKFSDLLLDITQEYSDNLGGDSAIINDVTVQAKPLYLSGADADVQWQGTVQTPPVPISGSAPLAVTAGQVLTYPILLSNGMDTSRMSGASPAAAAITAPAGTTWVFTSIHPTRPVLKITIGGTPGNITNLQLQGKSFSNSNVIAIQSSKDTTSIKLYGDRQQSISNQYIINSGMASTVASRLVSNYKNPTLFIPSVTVRPTWSAQINDRVTIVDDNTDINGDYIISGLNHSYGVSGGQGNAQTDLQLLRVTS